MSFSAAVEEQQGLKLPVPLCPSVVMLQHPAHTAFGHPCFVTQCWGCCGWLQQGVPAGGAGGGAALCSTLLEMLGCWWKSCSMHCGCRCSWASLMARSGALSAKARSESSSCLSPYGGNGCGDEKCLKLFQLCRPGLIFPLFRSVCALPVFALFLLLTVSIFYSLLSWGFEKTVTCFLMWYLLVPRLLLYAKSWGHLCLFRKQQEMQRMEKRWVWWGTGSWRDALKKVLNNNLCLRLQSSKALKRIS